MNLKEDDEYLGDVIASDGKNINNIKRRVGKGIGISNKIMLMVNEIPLGNHYFEVALMFRNSLLGYYCFKWFEISRFRIKFWRDKRPEKI